MTAQERLSPVLFLSLGSPRNENKNSTETFLSHFVTAPPVSKG